MSRPLLNILDAMTELRAKPPQDGGVTRAVRNDMDTEGSNKTAVLEISGQGTVSFEIENFGTEKDRPIVYTITLRGDPHADIVLELFDSTILCKVISTQAMAQAAAGGAEVPRVRSKWREPAGSPRLISFPESSKFVWVSVDRANQRLRVGQGYMMQQNTIVEFQTAGDSGDPGWSISNITTLQVDGAGVASPPKVIRLPVVQDPAPAVAGPSEITLDDLAANNAIAAAMLPPEAQVLYGTVAGPKIALTEYEAAAINYSIDTEGCTLYKIIDEKRQKDEREFGDPNMVYVRVTIGPDEGDSPGVPYVMEIWPKGCYSPVHNHAYAVAVIKVLHGNIEVTWFNPLADSGNPTEPAPLAVRQFTAGQVTFLTPEIYQTHQLRNPRSDTMCTTIQCYRYLDSDTGHYEYFDYLPKDGTVVKQFKPNSDITYSRLMAAVRNEYEDHLTRDRKKAR